MKCFKEISASLLTLLLITVFLFPSIAYSEDIYVNEQSSLTISKAVSIAKPGDTIFIDSGIYNEDVAIYNKGEAGKPITITASPGAKPIIQDGFIYLGSTAAHMVLSGFEIKDKMDESGIRFSKTSQYITIKNCTIHNVGYNGIYCQGEHHIIEDNLVYNTGQSDYPYKTHCIYLNANHSTIIKNTCYGSQKGNGIRSEGIDVTISQNSVSKNQDHGISVYADVPTNQFSISSNEVFQNQKCGIAVLGGSGGNVPDGVLISNNTIYDNSINVLVSGGSKNVSVVQNNLTDADQFHIYLDQDSATGFLSKSNTYNGSGLFFIKGQVYESFPDPPQSPTGLKFFGELVAFQALKYRLTI
jgi:hypothetical protein